MAMYLPYVFCQVYKLTIYLGETLCGLNLHTGITTEQKQKQRLEERVAL